MNRLRKALGLVVAALATAAPPSPADAVGVVCVTGTDTDTVYTGCAYVIVFPGFCYIGSEGAVAGTPYEAGPYRC